MRCGQPTRARITLRYDRGVAETTVPAERQGVGVTGARWRSAAAHARGQSTELSSRTVALSLGALTVLGFVLRVVGVNQSLFGDERYTYAIDTENGLRGVWHQVYTTSITPPLHYFLAWPFVQFGGDRTVLIRVPSLVLGTAMIPLIFVIGRRVAGSRIGLLAAGILVLSPFAIFYSTEARAYETMTFLVTLSTVALLWATDGKGRGWWVVYAIASCAAVWAHYTAVFVLLAQAVWALWTRPESRRALLIAEAAVVVGYLPWLPGYLHQRHNSGVAIFNALSSLTVGSFFNFQLSTVIGRPFIGLAALPGTVGLFLLAVLAGLAVAAVVHRPAALGRVPSLRSEAGLMIILAAATPIGLLLYALLGTNLWSADRELSASTPALIIVLALLIGALARAAPAWIATAAIAAMGALLVVIGVQSVDAQNQRPPYREVAQYLDNVAGNDPVVEMPLVLSADARLHQSTLSIYFKRQHPLYTWGQGDEAVWRGVSAGQTAFAVQPRQWPVLDALGLANPPAPLKARMAMLGGPDGLAIARSSRTFPGFYPLVVQRYQGAVTGRLERSGGRETISWSLGSHVTVSPGIARGAVTVVTPSTKPLLIGGWAVNASTRAPVDWFLLFSGGRLFAVQPSVQKNVPVARALRSPSSLLGFGLAPGDGPGNHARIQVFAVVGDHATELPFSEAARRDLQR
jgi:hypothetical protein